MTSSYNATWTDDSITYEFIVDTSDCTDIPKDTIIGDIQSPDGHPKVDATKNDLLVIGYDRLRQYPDSNDIQVAKLNYLSENARAASDEFASFIKDPVADENGHDELRRLLSLKKGQKKDLWATTVRKVKFTLRMIPEARLDVLGAAMLYSTGNPSSIATAALPRYQNGTVVGGIDLEGSLIIYGTLCLQAVQGMLAHASIILDQRGGFMGDPRIPFLTNLTFNAIIIGIAWLRRLARKLGEKRLAGLLSEPTIASIAEIGLESLPLLTEPPLLAPPGGEAVLTQSEVEAIGVERAKRATKGGANTCE